MSRGGARPGAGRKRKHSLGELVVLCAFYPGTRSHLRALAEDELVLPRDFPAEVAAELEGLRLEYVGSREVDVAWRFRSAALEGYRQLVDRAVRRA